MAKQTKDKILNLPVEGEKIELSGRQLQEINSSRLEIAAGHFIDDKILRKEVIIWLKNR